MSRFVTGGWVFLAALGVMLAGAPASKATSGGCFFPSFAAFEFQLDFLDLLDGLSADEKTCKKQCSDFESGCKQVVSASNQCIKNALGAVVDAAKAACKDEASKDDKKACKDDVKEGDKMLKDLLKEDKKDAKDDCKVEGDDCKSSCGGA